MVHLSCVSSILVAIALVGFLQGPCCVALDARQVTLTSGDSALTSPTSDVSVREGSRRRSNFTELFMSRRLLHKKQKSHSSSFKSGNKKRVLPSGIKVNLVHRDHVDSPLRGSANLTLTERIRRDVQRSTARSLVLSKRRGKNSSGRQTSPDDGSFVSTYNFESPLSATLAEYVMSLSIGTPPQSFVAVVDTGSDLVWLQCNPCVSCFSQSDPFLDPGQSSTYRPLACSDSICNDLDYNLQSCTPSCQYEYAYGDLSNTSGDFSLDTITLSTTSGAPQAVDNFAFGCGHRNQGTFSATDGLVGLGQGLISFPSQLGSLFGYRFSYCLVTREQALTQTSPLLFGDAAIPTASSFVQYTPLQPNNPGISSFYYVSLEGISVGGENVNIPVSAFVKDSSGNGGTIFDSGTTFTQLVQPAYDAVLQAFQLAIPYPQITGSPSIGLDLCYDISNAQNVVVPSLTFHFLNADFDLPAENFFVLVSNVGTMCLAISMSSTELNIIGNTQQQNFQVLYDRQASQIGFTPTVCNSLVA